MRAVTVPILDLDEVDDSQARRVAIGQFDGVHRGHRTVIEGQDAVLTFDPHPLSLLAPDRAPPALSSLARKAELLARLGVRELVVARFDRAFAAMPAAAFVDDVLVGRLGAAHVSVGENFRFGSRALGIPALLQEDARFTTRVAPLVQVDGEPVSSTRIRRLVQAGDVAAAAALLGSRVQVRGQALGVSVDRRRGQTTVSLKPARGTVLPPPGLYRCAGDRGIVQVTTAPGGLPRIVARLTVAARPQPDEEVALDLECRLAPA